MKRDNKKYHDKVSIGYTVTSLEIISRRERREYPSSTIFHTFVFELMPNILLWNEFHFSTN